jgi:hypothetical protein
VAAGAGLTVSRPRVLFVAPVDETEFLWTAGTLIERVTNAVGAGFPWRHKIVAASKVIPLDNSNDPAIAIDGPN